MARPRKVGPPKNWMPTKYHGRFSSLEASEATLNILFQAGYLNCSPEQAAPQLGVSGGTLRRFLASCPKAQAAFEDGRYAGEAALLEAQMRHAMVNPESSFKLGKIRLGQKDDMTITVRKEVKQLSEDELMQILQQSTIDVTPISEPESISDEHYQPPGGGSGDARAPEGA